ncbi:MAG: N-methyl-L-tryptophan oxidase [Gemmatimonadetes bacterium]|nr:N-methyl-L-tryptophan oxidase [Gemmatimonadota bacterium]
MSQKVYKLAVIGAGVNGLCALYQAAQRVPGDTVLLEQYPFGHDRGSSHGHSRVTRSAYVEEDYVRLMQVAHNEAWPNLERSLDRRLIHRCEGCFYGPSSSSYAKYAEAVARVGVDVVEMKPEDARQKFPQFTFSDALGVLIDRTGGVVAARDTIHGLVDYLRSRSELRDRTAVVDIDIQADPVRITTSTDIVLADRVVITAGPWAGKLLPEIRDGLQVIRQTVGYLRLDTDPSLTQPSRFPVWGYFGEHSSIGFYGLPEYGRPGIKVARHVVWNRNDDPDKIPDTPTQESLDDLEAFAAEHFTDPLKEIVSTEFCHYTNTSTEDFILDHHPANPNVVIGSGFSGHGFKFGPVTGRILTDLALDGHCDLPEYVSARERFLLRKRTIA